MLFLAPISLMFSLQGRYGPNDTEDRSSGFSFIRGYYINGEEEEEHSLGMLLWWYVQWLCWRKGTSV